MYTLAVLLYNLKIIYKIISAQDTGCIFNVHKMFRRHSRCLLNVSCTFSLRLVSMDINDIVMERDLKFFSLISTFTYYHWGKLVPINSEAYLEPSRTSTIEFFTKIINCFCQQFGVCKKIKSLAYGIFNATFYCFIISIDD